MNGIATNCWPIRDDVPLRYLSVWRPRDMEASHGRGAPEEVLEPLTSGAQYLTRFDTTVFI